MTRRSVCGRLGRMGSDGGNQPTTDGAKRPESVVSVRFAADEIALLRQLADAQKVPLSTLIRRAALAASASRPVAELLVQMNQGGAGSTWITYDSFSSQFTAESQAPETFALVNYQLPPPNTVS